MAALSPACSATGEDAAKTLVDGASGLLNTSSIGRFSSTANKYKTCNEFLLEIVLKPIFGYISVYSVIDCIANSHYHQTIYFIQ